MRNRLGEQLVALDETQRDVAPLGLSQSSKIGGVEIDTSVRQNDVITGVYAVNLPGFGAQKGRTGRQLELNVLDQLARSILNPDRSDDRNRILVRCESERAGEIGSLMSRDLPYPDSVKQFSSGKAETFTLEDYKVALHGRSFPTRLITADFVSAYPMRRDGWLNIGVLHTSLDGSRGHEGYAPCTVDDLKRYGYDYWALGHVHAAEIISRDPWIVFPGNLQGRNPRETGAKGAVRVTVEDGRIVDVTPLVLDGARWNHLSVDVSDGATERDMFDRIKSALEAAQVESGGRPLAARITVTGTTPLHNKLIAQHDELLDELRAAGFQAASDCWVEQVKIKTSAPALTAFRATDAESIDVEDLLSAAATDQQFAAELTNLVTTVADKMPKDLRDEFIQSEAVTTLAADARAMLLGRLS